jgi:hypothetical protein
MDDRYEVTRCVYITTPNCLLSDIRIFVPGYSGVFRYSGVSGCEGIKTPVFQLTGIDRYVYINMNVCVYAYIYAYICTYAYICAYIYMNIYIYVYV